MKKKKIQFTVFVIMEVLILGYLLALFLMPLKTIDFDAGKIIDKPAKEFADSVIKALKDKKLASMSGDFEDPNAINSLKTIDTYFGQNNLTGDKLINYSYTRFRLFTGDKKEVKVTQLQYSITFEKGYGLLVLDIAEQDSRLKIRGLKINPTEGPVEKMGSFYSQPMNAPRILLVVLALLLFGVLLFSEFDYYRIAEKPMVWLQILMPASVIAFRVDWSSLVLSIAPIMVSIMPAASTGVLTGWTFSLYVPVMLILYWTVFRRKAKAKQAASDEINQTQAL
jgi:hypothetical protein